MNSNTRFAAKWLTGSCIIQIFGYVIALPGHLGDPTWSWHAQFHHVLAAFWIAGLDILIIILAWGPLQRLERWGFRAALTGFMFAHLGHFASVVLVFDGRPPELWHNIALGLNFLIGLIGLYLFWKAIFAKRV
jgi:hypothetical protein